MIEYLKYLQENLNVDFKDKVDNDKLLSILLHEQESEDISVYDLMGAYLSFCHDVGVEYGNLIKDVRDRVDSKTKVLMKNLTISDIEKIDDRFYFKLSSKYPVPFSIRLEIEENMANNKLDNALEKSDYSDYKLLYGRYSVGDYRALVMAGIFNEYVNLQNLYNLLERMYIANSELSYVCYAEKRLPVTIELHDNGQISLYCTAGNDREKILEINKYGKVFFEVSNSNSDLFLNFDKYSIERNPIWVLKNIYVNSNDVAIPDLLEYDTDILDNIFIHNGMDLSMYRESTNEIKRYYVYGENNELIEIDNFIQYDTTDSSYIFVFSDDSSVEYPKDKVVVVRENYEVDYGYYGSEAYNSLNLK